MKRVSPASPPGILVVDDDPAAREILAEALEEGGYPCATAPGGAEALERIRKGGVGLVLSDIEMPGLSGVALLPMIKAHDADIDVVMVTGVVDVAVAIRALRDGASDYVTKPFNIEEVKIIVERTLEKRRLIRENRAYQQTLEQKVEERTHQLQTAYQEIQRTYQQTLEALIQALDMRDTETQGHSLRVVAFTVEIAVRLGVAEPQLTEIRRGALLHDIGKIGIPDAILHKPGRLDSAEWVVMRRHPELGHNMLAGIRFLDGAREIVLSHQERWDGTGYPRALAGEAIPLGARIFAAADTYDAMTSTRPYRRELPHEVARQEIMDFSGSQFDPAVVEAFLSIPMLRWEEIRDEVRRKVREEESRAAALNLLANGS